jgi:maltooligosyltrehalose trehalohydrolase
VKRHYQLPFGAECCGDKGVQFRFWAPNARNVAVCFVNAEATDSVAMERADGGWFHLVSPSVGAGSHYRFQIDGGLRVPDPASRFQPLDVQGPSEVIDPGAFDWQDDTWQGRPWDEAVIYELHVGTFTPEGTLAGLEQRLDYLVELGITAVELMPLADFPGTRNWGYDGVFPFAPDSQYGRPDDLKRFLQNAHKKGLMVFLDVVYNHFGPEGNYLRAYAPQFFTDRYDTPWGEAINFGGPESRVVRNFFVHNALYWLTEYHFDGLRFDAVHAIFDDSAPDILAQLAEAVRTAAGPDRHVHLVLENDNNASRYLTRDGSGRPKLYDAQWNDDIHHALHVVLTGEQDGYYGDYAERPIQHLGRCLTEGFDDQGEASPFGKNRPRGEPSRHLPPTAFVSFLQNHDQVGNRSLGERIVSLADAPAIMAVMAVLLLAPSPPLLFMGEEFGADTPFLFFCDFGPDLATAVTEGRRKQFACLSHFQDRSAQTRTPDPNDGGAFLRSRLDWNCLREPRHQAWLEFYRNLLEVRKCRIVPLVKTVREGDSTFETLGDRGLMVLWNLQTGGKLSLLANLGAEQLSGLKCPEGDTLYATAKSMVGTLNEGQVPAWSAAWFLRQ